MRIKRAYYEFEQFITKIGGSSEAKDYKFEMQFLIGVVAAVGGASSIRGIGISELKLPLTIIISLVVLHVCLLITVYTVHRISSTTSTRILKFEKMSSITLFFISTFSLYSVVSIVIQEMAAALLPDHISIFQDIQLLAPVSVSQLSFETSIITPVVSTLCTVMLVGVGLRGLVTDLRISRDIDIDIRPESIVVEERYEDSRPVSIQVQNKSVKRININVEVSIPKEVDWKEPGDGENSSERKLWEESLSPEEGERVFNLDLNFSTDIKDRKLERVIQIHVSHEYGEVSKEISTIINGF